MQKKHVHHGFDARTFDSFGAHEVKNDLQKDEKMAGELCYIELIDIFIGQEVKHEENDFKVVAF